LKFDYAGSFTNLVTTPTGHRISVPPNKRGNVVPPVLRHRTIAVGRQILPSIVSNERPVEYWRLCWDSITPSQNQLITKHPDRRLGNLYLAIGGSFHSWKFLPVIGEYVANVLAGNGNGEEMDATWSWKSETWVRPGKSRGAHEAVIPKWDLGDIEREVDGES